MHAEQELSDADATDRHPWLRWGAAGLLLLIFGTAVTWLMQPDHDQWHTIGQDALEKRKFDEAQAAVQSMRSLAPESIPASMLESRIAFASGDYSHSARILDTLHPVDPKLFVSLRIQAGDLHRKHLFQASEAERNYRAALEKNPQSDSALEGLAFVLGLTSRSFEAEQPRLELLRRPYPAGVLIWLLCLGDDALENPEDLAQFATATPDDPWIQMALARQAAERQEFDRAEELLKKAHQTAPYRSLITARYARLLLSRGKVDAARELVRALPASPTEHPESCLVKAELAVLDGQPQAAMREYGELLRRHSMQREACYQLGQLLIQAGRADDAKPFLHRAELIQQYVNAVKRMRSDVRNEHMLIIARLCDQLGLLWEAQFCWRQVPHDIGLPGERQAAIDLYHVIAPSDKAGVLERTQPEKNPARSLDLTAWPRYQPAAVTPSVTKNPGRMSFRSRPAAESAPAADLRLRMEDEAANRGVTFLYDHGPSTQGPKISEFTGGGVAVLDYDQDGWPDLYWTQGGRGPGNPQASVASDQFLRNQSGQFNDCTAASGLQETAFGQGVSVGDFDNDGFEDLLIGNIGASRLLLNQGDGTFRDASSEAGFVSNGWASSVLLADLNGDSVCDLYVVRYLQGAQLFQRVCPDGQGQPHSCLPQLFDAAADQLWLGNGDGTLQDVSSTAGILQPDGKGLGIVAVAMSDDQRLSLFIANDTTPNFWFRPQMDGPAATTTRTSKPPSDRWQDEAFGAGLAFSAEGRAQACMGVACGDAEGDALLDLLVTNYYDEPNAFYRQQPGGIFVDETRQVGLYDPSYKMLGFGTQFLDADNDGDLDLSVANGHVDDFRSAGTPYAMRPQLFVNQQGHFRELPGTTVGSYFEREHLGRGMSRSDFDRDGKEDLLISQLQEQAACVHNLTESPHHFVGLNLKGTTVSRDAIGATLTIRCGTRTITRQITAGDGYFASNDRWLIVGLGSATSVDELTIHWLNGERQTHTRLEADRFWRVIEQRSEPVQMSQFRQASLTKSAE